jgi:hypothetical protein
MVLGGYCAGNGGIEQVSIGRARKNGGVLAGPGVSKDAVNRRRAR